MNTCVVGGCDRPVLVKSRGLCRRHYLRWQRHGDPEAGGTALFAHVGCSVDGCERPHEAHGLCGPHYMRWWRGQDPSSHDVAPADPWERFLAKIEVAMHPDTFRPDLGPCWLWSGTQNPKGYGQIRRNYQLMLVHRYAYEHEVGPIPKGLDLDHLCRVHHCARPTHVEPATRSTNLRRGYEARRLIAAKKGSKP